MFLYGRAFFDLILILCKKFDSPIEKRNSQVHVYRYPIDIVFASRCDQDVKIAMMEHSPREFYASHSPSFLRYVIPNNDVQSLDLLEAHYGPELFEEVRSSFTWVPRVCCSLKW